MRLMLIAVSCLVTGACKDFSSDDSASADPVLATQEVRYGIEFDGASALLDTTAFNYTKSETYNATASITICDAGGGVHILTAYFLRVDTDNWDMYVNVDTGPVNIKDGSVGSFGQYKARLTFDSSNNLNTIAPAPMLIESLLFGSHPAQNIELSFDARQTIDNAAAYKLNLLAQDGSCST